MLPKIIFICKKRPIAVNSRSSLNTVDVWSVRSSVIVTLLTSVPCMFPPVSRSDHLYSFFVQWTPDMYGEGGETREPGFVVVKKNAETEEGEEKPVADITAKEWEVRLMRICCSHLLGLLASINSLPATVCVTSGLQAIVLSVV